MSIASTSRSHTSRIVELRPAASTDAPTTLYHGSNQSKTMATRTDLQGSDVELHHLDSVHNDGQHIQVWKAEVWRHFSSEKARWRLIEHWYSIMCVTFNGTYYGSKSDALYPSLPEWKRAPGSLLTLSLLILLFHIPNPFQVPLPLYVPFLGNISNIVLVST